MAAVEIVGGGIAGLTLARALRRPDWTVTVRERTAPETRREVDTAFGMWRPAMHALDAIGLGETVRQQGIRVTGATVRAADDRALLRSGPQDIVMIGRASLHRILRESLPESVIWRTEEIADSHALDAEVVVGADGARSAVRRDHWGERSAARVHGATVLRGVIEHDLSGGEVTEYWGSGTLFGITPVPGGRTNWFTAFPGRRFADAEEGLSHIRTVARGFPSRVSDVLAEATAEQTVVSGIHVSRGLRSFVRGRAVLIGDAAHAMTPNLGRGACEAIRDAVALGTLLGRYEPSEALARYSRRRLIAPQLIRAASSVVARVALAEGRAAEARNRLAGMLPHRP
ncbi:2-polyprenyl-6-methoxyphenol hydroxylase-like FAD-dependent oxidoreductase [Brevibacterium sanguinis]|uniref:2-polyprenyl-6-methoxyphenol hydroxylase-like FAD-dependent oxidoreductase n=2 Tax=Brevibacterium TaxID=1696 RepID=A0A366IM38_9MICO|nr:MULTISPECIES: FAD-dependent monooxygenase [Brevibacterium]RBP67272.1 2-polyprenyl-6-methoxyphenol hydroxylase-like FAD-dependent oxidoreductase [Brevibacterium sanguinis]RBP73797.1 2-polyprenyl-6-methoxyphenol hydroxylase-like FAD-dependent oxidoreductase [Brevibacterium celere]